MRIPIKTACATVTGQAPRCPERKHMSIIKTDTRPPETPVQRVRSAPDADAWRRYEIRIAGWTTERQIPSARKRIRIGQTGSINLNICWNLTAVQDRPRVRKKDSEDSKDADDSEEKQDLISTFFLPHSSESLVLQLSPVCAILIRFIPRLIMNSLVAPSLRATLIALSRYVRAFRLSVPILIRQRHLAHSTLQAHQSSPAEHRAVHCRGQVYRPIPRIRRGFHGRQISSRLSRSSTAAQSAGALFEERVAKSQPSSERTMPITSSPQFTDPYQPPVIASSAASVTVASSRPRYI